MTGNLLPIIDQLARLDDDRDRVDWLLRCPFSILRKYDFTIRNRLQIAGFPSGCDYLDAIGVAMQAVRDPLRNGLWGSDQEKLLHAAALQLWDALQDPEYVLPREQAATYAPPDPTEL
jgi:hypothetical protein